ncbi:hypothetical protein DFP72DRAFT_860632 [Ephemerocybe angulata]|uniref:Uncharacterized protein n=1 Tax=Ephemerocybe angulata TaxID=980116 RepID=A0A8H6H8C5_9AGAR|nr:hypothetical protein DFP72DRAFT_860632 [Tulosesus angulatus]
MPFDYFDPAFFNDLPPKLRAKAATSQAALLPDVELSFTRCAEERYSDAEFNAEFADARLAQYDMIDDGDLEFPPEDDGDEDMAGDDEEHEDGYGPTQMETRTSPMHNFLDCFFSHL